MKTILFKNTGISYSDRGKGTVIVFLHGFLENKNMWDYYMEVFSENYRVFAIDLLGHGKTEPLGYVHTMEDNAEMVKAVLSEFRIKKAVFIGHSMGGYVALAFAELYPQNVKGLVLLNSTSKADSSERKLNRTRAIKAVKQNYTAFINLAIENLFSENNRERLAANIALVKEEALKTPLQGIIASLEGMKIRKDREFILHTTLFPKLLILGKKDCVLNYEESISQIENTDVTLITFPDGHMSPVENQTELTTVLRDFFKGI